MINFIFTVLILFLTIFEAGSIRLIVDIPLWILQWSVPFMVFFFDEKYQNYLAIKISQTSNLNGWIVVICSFVCLFCYFHIGSFIGSLSSLTFLITYFYLAYEGEKQRKILLSKYEDKENK